MARLELIPVSGAVLCVRRPRYLSASYIVHDRDGIVLVDAGMEANGADMIEGLGSIGARVDDISAILLTHWHNDHSSGAEALRRASGARVYYHALEAPNFRRTAGVAAEPRLGARPLRRPPGIARGAKVRRPGPPEAAPPDRSNEVRPLTQRSPSHRRDGARSAVAPGGSTDHCAGRTITAELAATEIVVPLTAGQLTEPGLG